MILGMLMMFLLFVGLTLVFAANFIKVDKQRALLLLVGMIMAIIPLGILLASFFFPIFD
jgi:hypothetical protein